MNLSLKTKKTVKIRIFTSQKFIFTNQNTLFINQKKSLFASIKKPKTPIPFYFRFLFLLLQNISPTINDHFLKFPPLLYYYTVHATKASFSLPNYDIITSIPSRKSHTFDDQKWAFFPPSLSCDWFSSKARNCSEFGEQKLIGRLWLGVLAI
jgi:hypothetical protein